MRPKMNWGEEGFALVVMEEQNGSESKMIETIEDYIVEDEESEEEGDRGLVVSSINRAPNQAAAKMATNYGHNNTKWRQHLKGNMMHVKYYCKWHFKVKVENCQNISKTF